MAIHERIPAQRIQSVLEYINAEKSVSVHELVEKFGVSEGTARRDLDELANEGQVVRTHGGAMSLNEETTAEKFYKEKSAVEPEAKRAIGQMATLFVRERNTILLDSGTTAYQIALALSKMKNLTIITNDLFLAANIEFDPSTTLLVTGGMKRMNQNVLIGEETEKFFLKLANVDIAFLTADAIDIDHGITNAGVYEVSVKKAIVKAARKKILCADSSKLNKVLAFKVCGLEAIDVLLTDDRISETEIKKYESRGIKITTAAMN